MKAAGMTGLAIVCMVAAIYAGGRPLRSVSWRAPDIKLVIGVDSAYYESACAHATIREAITVNKHGEFMVAANYFQEGGPIQQPPVSEPAHFVGDVRHRTMSLTIYLDETGEMIGPIILTPGNSGPIIKCL